MARILIAYSTVDGHTLKICECLQRSLELSEHSVTLASLSDTGQPDIHLFDKVVIGASIRYGRHRREVYDFIRLHRDSLDLRPTAFFSVNVVARKPGKDSPAGNPYVQAFQRKTSWRPSLVGVFAGKIDYPKYGLLDRQVIRLIMWLTHGPTGRADCVDFTNWESVDTFAQGISAL
jgi:menaquinone-dependent protoporphyrinogen oxidase